MQHTSWVSEMSEEEDPLPDLNTFSEDYILSGRSRDVMIEWLREDPKSAMVHVDDIIEFMMASRRNFLATPIEDWSSQQDKVEMARWYATGVDPFGEPEAGWARLTGQQKVGRIADYYKKSDQIVWNAISKYRK